MINTELLEKKDLREQLIGRIDTRVTSLDVSEKYGVSHEQIMFDIFQLYELQQRTSELTEDCDLKKYILSYFSLNDNLDVPFYSMNSYGLNILLQIHKEYFLKDIKLHCSVSIGELRLSTYGDMYKFLYQNVFVNTRGKDKYALFSKAILDIVEYSNCSDYFALAVCMQEILAEFFDIFDATYLNIINRMLIYKYTYIKYMESPSREHSEKIYQQKLIKDFGKIFPQLIFVKEEFSLPNKCRIDILAKEKSSKRDVIFELKVDGKNPTSQLLLYSTYFDNAILIGITENKIEDLKKTHGIEYLTYKELGIN